MAAAIKVKYSNIDICDILSHNKVPFSKYQILLD